MFTAVGACSVSVTDCLPSCWLLSRVMQGPCPHHLQAQQGMMRARLLDSSLLVELLVCTGGGMFGHASWTVLADMGGHRARHSDG